MSDQRKWWEEERKTKKRERVREKVYYNTKSVVVEREKENTEGGVKEKY